MFGNPVEGPRIVPFGEARGPADYISRNGHVAFRVTQRYGDWDAYFRDRVHGAMDVANYWCGDRVLAMESGTVRILRDPNGALGVEVQHASGYRTQIWHVTRIVVATGARVARGQHIAHVGSTGLNIGGCHAHVVVLDPSGRNVDPWPLLDQNSSYRVLKGPGINIRSKPSLQSVIYATSEAGGIRRRYDRKIIAPLSTRMRYRRTLVVNGTAWDEVLLYGSYRWVASSLLNKVR